MNKSTFLDPYLSINTNKEMFKERLCLGEAALCSPQGKYI